LISSSRSFCSGTIRAFKRFCSGTIRAFKKAALECDEAKFEQYKLVVGDHITPEIIQTAQSCFDKIRGLES
jgi:ribonuclease P/MRP protein subunit POP5